MHETHRCALFRMFACGLLQSKVSPSVPPVEAFPHTKSGPSRPMNSRARVHDLTCFGSASNALSVSIHLVSTFLTPYFATAVASFFQLFFSSTLNWPRKHFACDIVHTSHVRILFCHCAKCLMCSLAPFRESVNYRSAQVVSSVLVNPSRCCLVVPIVPLFPNSQFSNYPSFLHPSKCS